MLQKEAQIDVMLDRKVKAFCWNATRKGSWLIYLTNRPLQYLIIMHGKQMRLSLLGRTN